MGHIPTREDMKKAYNFYTAWNDNKRYKESDREPLSREEIDEEFEAGMKKIETSAKAEGYKIARETMQGSIDEAMREFGEKVFEQGYQARQNDLGSADKTPNPFTKKMGSDFL